MYKSHTEYPPHYLCERVSYDDEYESYLLHSIWYSRNTISFILLASSTTLSLHEMFKLERNVINVPKEGGKLNCDD